jgi:hypothetical protein
VRLKASLLVGALGPRVLRFDQQAQCPDPTLPAACLNKPEDLRKMAFALVLEQEIHFIQNGMPPVKLNTEPKGQHGVTDGFFVQINPPNVPNRSVRRSSR